MCDNQYNFAHPWNNSFYYQYMQQHAALSNYFQKLHSNIQYGTPFCDVCNPGNASHPVAYSSSCCSCCSCCSSESCSASSSSEYEETESEEEYDEQQNEDENYDDDESECEYEFNVDAILQMRAVKEELRKQELLESKREGPGSSELKDEKASESDDEGSSDSKEGKESKSDSIVVVDSDKEDFEFVDLSSTKILDCNLYKNVGGFHKTKEEENRKVVMEYIYGSARDIILSLETSMELDFEKYYDDHQPSLWPVLPVRL